MERLTYRFSLDTHKNGSQRTLQGFETGDTMARRFVISLTENEDTYDLPLENIVAIMYVKKPDGTLSYNDCTIDGNEITYDCAATDFEQQGTVSCQLKVIAGTVESPSAVLVSPRFDVEVWESLVEDSAAEATATFTSLEAALAKAQAVYNSRITSFSFDDSFILTVVYGYDEEEQTQVTYETDIFLDAINNMEAEVADHYPTIEVGTVTTGSPSSVVNSGTVNHAVFDFVLEKGDKGDDGADGQDGADGYSPSASVTKVDDTATITITDINGTTTASISDGADGQNGIDGQDGADGFSPSASVTKVGDTATITITDKDGTTTASISDGTGGDTVTWNQLQSTGTKIATITINSTDTDIYAPTSGGGGGASSLSQLDDVTISSASNGQTLTYDSSASKWKNASLSIPADIDDLSDVTISSATDGQVLTYDNANSIWKNASLPSGVSDLDDLSDVTISSASNGQVLTYDNVNSKWKNQNIPSQAWGDITSKPFTSIGTNLSVTNGVLSATDTTYSSESESQGGTAVSLCTTGEKYTWNHKADASSVGTWATSVSGAVGATSITFSDASILTTSILDLYSENTSGTPIQYTSATVTTGSVTFAIPALTEATTFKLWIRNI